jgi:hypothetical protein
MLTAQQRWPNAVITGTGRYAFPLRDSNGKVTRVRLFHDERAALDENISTLRLVDLNEKTPDFHYDEDARRERHGRLNK